jgi:hypothetical protein
MPRAEILMRAQVRILVLGRRHAAVTPQQNLLVEVGQFCPERRDTRANAGWERTQSWSDV